MPRWVAGGGRERERERERETDGRGVERWDAGGWCGEYRWLVMTG